MGDQKTVCENPNHHHHMCARKEAGMEAFNVCGTKKATVKCGICGAEAESANDVCTPVNIWEEEQLS